MIHIFAIQISKKHCPKSKITAAREVISYYKQRGSQVYACLLDCSKAFDKIRFDILFPRLLAKGVSPVILRLLFHSYLNSQVRVKWNRMTSELFNISNGVRQGAVLSPFLFNVYIDELICGLKQEGQGCWVGSQYYGILNPISSVTRTLIFCNISFTLKGIAI